jgi:hypothetical protein
MAHIKQKRIHMARVKLIQGIHHLFPPTWFRRHTVRAVQTHYYSYCRIAYRELNSCNTPRAVASNRKVFHVNIGKIPQDPSSEL